MKAKLTEADKEYIAKNWKDKKIQDLVDATQCKEKPIKDYIAILANEIIDTLRLVGKPPSHNGATIMNQNASMAGDDFAKLPRPERDTSKHIHRCKE